MTRDGARRFAQHDRAVDHAASSRPFDVDRDGFVMGEGAGVLVLEEWDARQSRAAPRSSARSLGAASNADAHHITAPVARRRRARSRAWSWRSPTPASTPADIAPDQRPRHVDAAQRRRRGRGRSPRCSATPGPPVTSIKGVTGHALGAAGALEAAAVAAVDASTG